MNQIERGLIVFDKSERSLRGLAPLVAQHPETGPFVERWASSDNEILLWVLAVHPENCRVIELRKADDLVRGALEEFADELGESVYRTRIATGPLPADLATAVRARWRKIGGLAADQAG